MLCQTMDRRLNKALTKARVAREEEELACAELRTVSMSHDLDLDLTIEPVTGPAGKEEPVSEVVFSAGHSVMVDNRQGRQGGRGQLEMIPEQQPYPADKPYPPQDSQAAPTATATAGGGAAAAAAALVSAAGLTGRGHRHTDNFDIPGGGVLHRRFRLQLFLNGLHAFIMDTFSNID